MKARVVTRVTINAAPKTVFGYLTNTKYHHLWNPRMQQVSPLGPLKQGQHYKAENVVLGVRVTAKNLVVKLVPDEELELENNTGMIHYHVNFHLQRDSEATVVVCTTVVSSESKAFAFTKPVLGRLARLELQTDLQALKIAAEHKLAGK